MYDSVVNLTVLDGAGLPFTLSLLSGWWGSLVAEVLPVQRTWVAGRKRGACCSGTREQRALRSAAPAILEGQAMGKMAHKVRERN